MQLVSKARYKAVDSEDIFKFFSEVMASEVKNWQRLCPDDSISMGNVIYDCAKVAPISKVYNRCWSSIPCMLMSFAGGCGIIM